ncbi:RTA1 like protein, partial [Diplocarpon rosae]
MTRAPIDARSNDGNIYAYDANEDAAIVAAVFFGLVTGLQLGMMLRKETYFYLPLVCGGFMMTGGYVVRYLSAQSPDRASLYAAQSLLLLLPPSLFAATLYMTYGRIVMLVKKTDASVIRPERVTGIFVVGDLLAFSVQLAGGGLLVSDGESSIGKIVVLAGLGIQRPTTRDHPHLRQVQLAEAAGAAHPQLGGHHRA